MGSAYVLCQLVPFALSAPETVSALVVLTVTALILLPLSAVTEMPLDGSASLLPAAGEIDGINDLALPLTIDILAEQLGLQRGTVRVGGGATVTSELQP